MLSRAVLGQSRLAKQLSCTPSALRLDRLWLHNNSKARAGNLDLPTEVTLVEVSPRDGLQNEKQRVSTATKIELVEGLVAAGLQQVEVTSFVSPVWVPQLADAAQLCASIFRKEGVKYPVLVPNLKGFQRARAAAATEIAVFTAASEQFCKKNTNCSIQDSLKRIEEVIAAAKDSQVAVRGYVSCVVGCPYQGNVEPKAAAKIAGKLYEMGCYEVSMGDTIGVGTPASVAEMFKACKDVLPVEALAAHMHDTYGQAVANILTSLGMGIKVVDTAVAGLGGCPYAKGATGNVATEDVVYMLNGLGIKHGVDMDKLLDVSERISVALGRPNNSRAAKALLAARTGIEQ